MVDGASHSLELVGRARIAATLRVLSGLHIGAGKDTIEIGGIDNPVIKTPEGDPYVPGSSIKGKLRFLLEWAFGTVDLGGQPWGMNSKLDLDPDDPVARIFGTPAKRDQWASGPTRLIIRDAPLDDNWRRDTLDKGLLLTEGKTEVMIDRIAGKAHDRVGPRQTERVPQGAGFEFEAVFRLYAYGGDGGRVDRNCLAWMIQGLDLLEQDALGGSGSRGYGRIRFENLTLTGKETVQLDNVFRNHTFSRNAPPSEILEQDQAALGTA